MKSPKLEEHQYIEFLKMVLKSGMEVQWDDNEANIKSGKNFRVRASFSYNEPKIWFTFASSERAVRVLDSGPLAAEYLIKVEAEFRKLEAAMDDLEDQYCG